MVVWFRWQRLAQESSSLVVWFRWQQPAQESLPSKAKACAGAPVARGKAVAMAEARAAVVGEVVKAAAVVVVVAVSEAAG